MRAAGLTIAAVPVLALALAACAALPADGPAPAGPASDTCRSDPGQRFVGQRATAESGAAILSATRSREIRWIPPGVIVTMEYKFGRVTVSYDEEYRILRVSCG
jgi:hypothetical protein